MNKTEKIISLILGCILAWYIFSQADKNKKAAQEAAKAVEVVQKPVQKEVQKDAPAQSAVAKTAQKSLPKVPEKVVSLENDELKIDLTTWGGAVKKASLKKYAKGVGKLSEDNPPVEFDFSSSMLGVLSTDGKPLTEEAYEVDTISSNIVVFKNSVLTRKVTLFDGYRLRYEDEYNASISTPVSVSLGLMRMGDSKNDLLSVDSWAIDGKERVIHHGEGDSPLETYLVAGLSGGCGGSKNPAGMPELTKVPVHGRQKWIAVKNRFFVTALCPTEGNFSDGFDASITRDLRANEYKLSSVAVEARFAPSKNRTMDFYVGPKKQALLWELGMKDVMEFGMWRWICYPLVAILNFFHSIVPSFGMAIIFLTILVRLIFWPLTHKSTVGMRKMQEIQPKMKELQAKFKDNPQRLQQETWALYKQENVNPMSSCLPMLAQIPVFIALFNVLRSAVELRYAPFLWISDLSEPEALFASWFPFGGLNILPVLMAVTTALQSAFSPSTGDKNQQKMMMVFMPIMMLVMFYSFPSALSLYWFLSNIFSIVQMWIIRRQTATQRSEVIIPEVIDTPSTRQMRRHG
ncbi:MAG: membrane protein insertase YidC [Kiritimatiellae bacterium]|nr:membrane protein insertase YidC [Kiritimatiellia bacterium]